MAGKKAFGELQFKDSFMFAAAMEDEEICRGVLERVLGIPIKKVRIQTEATLLVNPDYRGVRLDVYADNEEGSVYDVEMQTTDKHNLPKRSRLYQGQMDMALLEPGDDFNRLPRSFVIFICTYDPFGYGRYRYTCDTSSLFSKFMCIECLISAPGVRLRSDGVVGATASFAAVHLVGIAGAICTRTWETDYWVP